MVAHYSSDRTTLEIRQENYFSGRIRSFREMNFSNIANLNGFNRRALLKEIALVESSMRVQFPVAYKEVLLYSDGALLDSGVTLYRLEDIVERNETYEVGYYCSGYLLIGDDGGGRGFLIALENDDPLVVSSGLGNLDPVDFSPVATTLQEWVNRGLSV